MMENQDLYHTTFFDFGSTHDPAGLQYESIKLDILMKRENAFPIP